MKKGIAKTDCSCRWKSLRPIDKFGGSKETAIGKKANPGPLYGVKKDIWAALAVAVTWAETNGENYE